MAVRRITHTLLIVLVIGLLAGSCAPAPDTAGGDGSCEKDQLTLVEPGVLTVGTDSPAFPPWFVDDDPSNGEGFESAVAYAVAEELGFSEDEVQWVVVPFNTSFQPGEKDFDFDINQISITEEREQAVDFSDGYYDVNQALVGFADSPIADAAMVSDLKQYRLGAQVGTTSLDFIEEVIQPDQDPLVYDTNADAKAAFDAGQVDGIVTDLPTAFFISAVEIEGSAVIGQFPTVGEDAEQFGMLFEEGSPLVECVNQALDRLKESGRLEEIEQRWLSEAVDAPVIEIDQ